MKFSKKVNPKSTSWPKSQQKSEGRGYLISLSLNSRTIT